MKANHLNQYTVLIGLDWTISIKNHFPEQRIAICPELKNGHTVYALLKYHWFDQFPVVPTTLAEYREHNTCV